jgi:hypothetical protein
MVSCCFDLTCCSLISLANPNQTVHAHVHLILSMLFDIPCVGLSTCQPCQTVELKLDTVHTGLTACFISILLFWSLCHFHSHLQFDRALPWMYHSRGFVDLLSSFHTGNSLLNNVMYHLLKEKGKNKTKNVYKKNIAIWLFWTFYYVFCFYTTVILHNSISCVYFICWCLELEDKYPSWTIKMFSMFSIDPQCNTITLALSNNWIVMFSSNYKQEIFVLIHDLRIIVKTKVSWVTGAWPLYIRIAN